MKSILFLICALTVSFAAFAEEPRQLSSNESALLDVEVRVIVDATSHEKKVLYKVLNDFTNTVKCDVDVMFPVVTADGKDKFVAYTAVKQLSFPQAAFPSKDLAQEIKTASLIGEDEEIKPNWKRVLPEAAVCTGLGPNNPLPLRSCLSLVSNHNQQCAQMGDGPNKRYPLFVNNHYIGICECQ